MEYIRKLQEDNSRLLTAEDQCSRLMRDNWTLSRKLKVCSFGVLLNIKRGSRNGSELPSFSSGTEPSRFPFRQFSRPNALLRKSWNGLSMLCRQTRGRMKHCFAYKLHLNTFGGRSPSGPAGGADSAPQTSF